MTGEFCPRLIVTDGIILWVSAIGGAPFSGSTLWIPSPTEFIASECISQSEGFKTIVFENGSRLEQIETEMLIAHNIFTYVL
jgi:hypothetical protein